MYTPFLLDGGILAEMGKGAECAGGCWRKKSLTCLSILLTSTLGNELFVLGFTYWQRSVKF